MQLQGCKISGKRLPQQGEFTLAKKVSSDSERQITIDFKQGKTFDIKQIRKEAYTINVGEYQKELDLSNLKNRQTYYLDLTGDQGLILQPPLSLDYLQFVPFDGKEDKSIVNDQSQSDNLQTSFPNKSISSVNNSQYEKVLNKIKSRGQGISEFQSSSSLMHSIPEVSFSKADRFLSKPTIQTEINYNIPTMFVQNKDKGCSFGYGQKYLVPEYIIKNAKQNPAPDSYFKPDNYSSTGSLGKFKRTSWSQSSRFNNKLDVLGQIPAPNNYDIHHDFGKSKTKFSFGQKTKLPPPFIEQVPSPLEYNQSFKAIFQNRYSGISLGYGEKTDFGKGPITPGPGAYEVSSVFKKSGKYIAQKVQAQL